VSTQQVQEARKGQAILDAAELIERSKPDTPHLSAAMAEVLAQDEYRIAAILYEVAELATRQERAIDHLEGHVLAAREREIQALEQRVSTLEAALELTDSPKES
jgi:hypothetical protein